MNAPGENWRESARVKERKKTRDIKWRRAEKKRRLMTDDELAAEEARLIEEAAILAASKGLDDSYIGHNWTRSEALELETKGTGE